jgi:Flp pilus assembly protein TadG
MRVKRPMTRRRAAAAVEVAILLPVFVMLVFAQIEASRLAMVAQVLTVAAREGCRVAVLDGKTQSDVTARVDGILNSAGLTGVTMTQVPADCTTVRASSTPNTIRITLSVPFSSVSWPSPSQYFGGATVSGTATMSSERP